MRIVQLIVIGLIALFSDTAFGACSNPAGQEGEITYITNHSMMAYCDNTNWVAMGRKEVAELNEGAMPTSGLVGHWKLDETSGTMATDSAGSNNGTLKNMDGGTDWVSGKLNNALDFDGSNDYVDSNYSDSYGPSDDFNVSFWFKPDLTSAGSDEALFGSRKGNSQFYIEIDRDGSACNLNEVRLAFSDSDTTSAADEVCAPYGNGTAVYHHLSVNYDADGDIEVFINSISRDTTAVTGLSNGTIDVSTRNFAIGAFNQSGAIKEQFNGKIDDVRIYDRTLTPDEIATLAGATLQTGLVGHWKLDETSGTTATDSSSNGNDGTMQGGLDAANDSVTGKIGTALDFDGVDDYVRINDQNVFSPVVNDMSVSVWAKVPVSAAAVGDVGGCGNTGALLLSKGSSANGWEWLFENNNNSKICFTTHQSTGSPHAVTYYNMTLNDGGWHHYVGTIDYLNRQALYVDGVEVSSVTSFTGTMTNSISNVLVGRRSDGNYFTGQMDDVRMYNRALSNSEIAQLYCVGAPGKIDYDTDNHVMTFCSDQDRHAMGPIRTPPASCPNIGDTCDDGSLYAGIYSNKKLYITPAQSLGDVTWNNGSSSWSTTGATSWSDGEANTAAIMATATGSPHEAASICHNLTDHGRTDWYLPAPGELLSMTANYAALGFWGGVGQHWSSQESNSSNARLVRVNNGSHGTNFKNTTARLRCVRSEPLTCDNIGDVCPDGTVYAGLSTDGNVDMYTTPSDAPSTYYWELRFNGWTDKGATSSDDGDGNTAILMSLYDPAYPFEAAEYCNSLTTGGHDDWYLPAPNELNVLYINRVAIGNFTTNNYWSSAESSASTARRILFLNGGPNNSGVATQYNIRCVRKGKPYTCFNPNGVEGEMTYNTTQKTWQYCNGAEWVGVGK